MPLFGKRKTPQQQLREHKRALDRAIRDLDRERQGLEKQEKKIIADIKKMAKNGEMDTVKIMAKDLVRTRNHVKKFMKMRTQLQGVSLRIQTLKSSAAMGQAMKGVTRAMGAMNRQLNMGALTKIMMDFEKQSEIMDMKGEMQDDAIDEAMGSEEDEEEENAVVDRVLDEIGIDLTGAFAAAPGQSVAAAPDMASKEENELAARLASLKQD